MVESVLPCSACTITEKLNQGAEDDTADRLQMHANCSISMWSNSAFLTCHTDAVSLPCSACIITEKLNQGAEDEITSLVQVWKCMHACKLYYLYVVKQCFLSLPH